MFWASILNSANGDLPVAAADVQPLGPTAPFAFSPDSTSARPPAAHGDDMLVPFISWRF